jgi:hypothetical protein
MEGRPQKKTGVDRRLRLGAVLAVAIAVGFIAWLILKDDNDNGNESVKTAPASAASEQDLRALRDSVGHPIYWAGTRKSGTYELTRTPNGNIYIRYLPTAGDVGAPRPDFLTVGTYPFKNALKTLQRLARKQGQISRNVAGGGIAVANGPQAQNVYLAFAGQNFQIEVYDRHPGRALKLATSGRIEPLP